MSGPLLFVLAIGLMVATARKKKNGVPSEDSSKLPTAKSDMREFVQAVGQEGARYTGGYDPDSLATFLDTVAWRESKYNPEAVNRSSGATGLFQLFPSSAFPTSQFPPEWQGERGARALTDAYINAAAFIAYLHRVAKYKPRDEVTWGELRRYTRTPNLVQSYAPYGELEVDQRFLKDLKRLGYSESFAQEPILAYDTYHYDGLVHPLWADLVETFAPKEVS